MRHNDAFVLRSIEGQYILMPIKKNETSDCPVAFNRVAADIWRSCKPGTTIEDICQRITDEYGLVDDSSEQLAVIAFTNQLVDMGFLIRDDQEEAERD